MQSNVHFSIDLSAVSGVKGLKWGNYVGSPSESAPSVVWSSCQNNLVISFVPLITNDVFGLPSCTSLLMTYNKVTW